MDGDSYRRARRILDKGGIALLEKIAAGEPEGSPLRQEYRRLMAQWMALGADCLRK